MSWNYVIIKKHCGACTGAKRENYMSWFLCIYLNILYKLDHLWNSFRQVWSMSKSGRLTLVENIPVSLAKKARMVLSEWGSFEVNKSRIILELICYPEGRNFYVVEMWQFIITTYRKRGEKKKTYFVKDSFMPDTIKRLSHVKENSWTVLFFSGIRVWYQLPCGLDKGMSVYYWIPIVCRELCLNLTVLDWFFFQEH